jgi:GNAT superfamily N-acetyltransferase
VAVLVPARSVTSVEEVLAALDAARADGFTSAMSPALEPAAAVAWLAAGFERHEQLLLFHHDLSDLPDRTSGGPPLRRATGLDRHRAVAIDRSAFDDEFWRFDDLALREAVLATRQASFRIDWWRRAYAVSGVADGRAFLQRLAVAPAAQRRGLGRALTLDALRWARRSSARSMSVNTQVKNAAARSLYERLGFCIDPDGLVVLRWVPR